MGAGGAMLLQDCQVSVQRTRWARALLPAAVLKAGYKTGVVNDAASSSDVQHVVWPRLRSYSTQLSSTKLNANESCKWH